jgi:hypothetical protein
VRRSRPPALLACVLAAALIFPAASQPAGGQRFPVLYVVANNSFLSGSVNLDIDAEFLDFGGETERMTILVPAGYGIDLAHPVNKNIGEAYVSTVPIGGGKETVFGGPLVVMGASAYAGSASAQACAPGGHVADWEMRVRSAAGVSLRIPLAVDRTAKGSEFTMCFDDEHALGQEVRIAQFLPMNVFATPAHAGRYLFDSIVTPFSQDGSSPDTSGAYELRAYEDLPANLTANPTYDSATKTLAVSGTLKLTGRPRAGVTVQIMAGSTSDANTMTQVGLTQTGKGGAYSFRKKLASGPKYMYSQTMSNGYPVCVGSSAAPSGCASYSVDGTGSSVMKVGTAG